MTHPTRTSPCAGPCNRAWRRAEAERAATGKPHNIEPNHGQPLWCDRCTTTVARALDRFPALIAAIRDEALHGTPPRGIQTRRGGAVPSWPGEASRHLIDTIIGGLTELEDDVRARRGFSQQYRLPENGALASAVDLLVGNLEWILQQHPDASDPLLAPGTRILLWERLAVRFTKDDRPRVHRKQLPCPNPGCGLLALTQAPGDDSIECGACGLRLREDEYQRRARSYAIRQTGQIIMGATPTG